MIITSNKFIKLIIFPIKTGQ